MVRPEGREREGREGSVFTRPVNIHDRYLDPEGSAGLEWERFEENKGFLSDLEIKKR